MRLHMDETALALFLPSRFLPVLMSIREETRRQAEISLRPASPFFKENADAWLREEAVLKKTSQGFH